MATRKTRKPAATNGRATVRDVLKVVQATNTRIDGLHERADETNQRIDAAISGQQTISQQMTDLHTCMTKLERTTNHRLHEMEADITTLKRPWLLLASGWSKAIALGGFAAAITGIIVRLELWRFLPF